MNKDVKIRIATPQDGAALAQIYAPYVMQTAITFSNTAPTAQQFSEQISQTLCTHPFLVAEQNGTPIGYAYAAPLRQREAYQWSVETSIYIRQDCKQSGLGRLLYHTLEHLLAAQGICSLYACIATSADAQDPYLTPASIHFHERMGYRQVGTFTNCGSKFGRWYGVIWMEKSIAPHQPSPTPTIPFPQLPPTVLHTL